MATSKGQSKRRPAPSGKARAAAGYGRDGARTRSAVPATPTSGQAGSRPGQAVPRADSARRAEPVTLTGPAAAAEVPERPAGVPPLWLQWVTFVLSIGGLAVAAYETYAHFNGSKLLYCTGNGSENCTAVITSPQSMVFGVIPVAILGLVFFVFAVPLFSPWGWQSRWRPREVGLLRLASMVAGMGFVMYLIYAELFQIGSWCLYCTVVHVITFVLFCITVIAAALWGLPKREAEREPKRAAVRAD